MKEFLGLIWGRWEGVRAVTEVTPGTGDATAASTEPLLFVLVIPNGLPGPGNRQPRNQGPGCGLGRQTRGDDQGAHWPLPSPSRLCLNTERSRIPAHLKQVLFQGNQGAGPERNCSPASSTGTGPGFRKQAGEKPARGSPQGKHTGAEIKVGEPLAWGPSPSAQPPWRRTEQASRRGMCWLLAPAYTEITFFSKTGGRKLLPTPHPRLS